MKYKLTLALFIATLVIAGVASGALAQSQPAQQPAATSSATQTAGDDGINTALKKYIGAYEHKNLQELKAVWPRVDQQGKEYDKIQAEFADASSGALRVTLKPLETEKMNDQAIVQCERTRQYQTEEKRTQDVMGDNSRANMIERNQPGDAQVKVKTNVRTEKVWIALRREGDNWFISSVSEKKPKL